MAIDPAVVLSQRLEENRSIRDDLINKLAVEEGLTSDPKSMNILLKALSDSDKSLLSEVKLQIDQSNADANKELVELAAEVVRQNPGRDMLARPIEEDTETDILIPEVDKSKLAEFDDVSDGEMEAYSEPQSYDEFMNDRIGPA